MCQENQAPLSGSLPKENKLAQFLGQRGAGAEDGEREKKVAELLEEVTSTAVKLHPLTPPYDPILISGNSLPFTLS